MKYEKGNQLPKINGTPFDAKISGIDINIFGASLKNEAKLLRKALEK